MSLEGEAEADRRGEPRVAFDGAVRLRYRLFQKFLEENAANISAGGMFIRTIHPGEPGTRLDFEIRLDDDDPLIQGRGEVAWVRRGGERPGAEPGMGIRFVELPDDSRALVDKIVAERVAAGLELFDLARQAPPAAPGGERTVSVAASPPDERPIWQLDSGGPEMGSAAAAGARQADPAGGAASPAKPDGEATQGAIGTPAPAGSAGIDPREPPAAAAPAARGAEPEPKPPEPEEVFHVPLDPEMPATAASATTPKDAAGRPAGPPGAAVDQPTAAGRASPVRLVAVALLSALVGAGAVSTFYWLYVQPSIEALETRIDELAGRPGGPWQPPPGDPEPRAAVAEKAGSGAAASEAAESATAPAPAAPDPVAEVTAALRGWAAAWSEQRVEDYLGYYASGFEPPDGRGRAAWAEARRARIERPRWIRVALTLVQVEPAGPDAAVARFVQSYRAERYQDLVRKRLRMVREDGGWKIAEERVEG